MHTCASRIVNMDRMSALLDGPRARGAFVVRCLLQPPWAIHVCDRAPLTIVAVVRGDAWITQNDKVVPVPQGSVALIVGPEPYDLGSAVGRAADVVIHPGQHCETPDGVSLEMSMRLGVRTWGHGADAPSAILTGTYEQHSALGAELLAALPTPLIVRRPDPDPLVGLLAAELTNDAPGQQTVLDRLLDALTVDTLRAWYIEQDRAAPAWWLGHHDPIIGEALRLIHDEPERDWTIVSLARSVGTSRANLARRFTTLVGEPVMTYLTRWRMTLAADLLANPETTVASVASQVGYASPFGFSTAFKRRYGVSPTLHRQLPERTPA
jgi:AraC-like DNA-binding protein